jgi:exopolysaccharide biosynthesis polyprenyl glycosylphosphotransferase
MTIMPMRLDSTIDAVADKGGVRKYSRLAARRIVVAADVLAAAFVFGVTRETIAFLAIAVAVIYWRFHGLYGRRFSLSILDDIGTLTVGGVWGVMALVFAGEPPRDALITGVLFVGAAIVARAFAYQTILWWRSTGRDRHPVVVIGAGLNGISLIRRIVEHPNSGLEPVGFLDEVPPEGTLPLPLLGRPAQLASIVAEHDITDVIVAYGKMPTGELVSVLRTCHALDVQIYVVPRLFEMHRLTRGSDHVWGLPLVPLRQTITSTWARRVKRLVDIVVSGLALLVLAPVIAVVAALVRWDLGPGVLFEQERIGLDGEAFKVHKFRSMKNLPRGVDSPWNVTDDGRFGHVGRFLRRFSLDEIPQLYNVLIGDMSLVGPRPERPEYVDQFSSLFRRYGDRHRVPVGLTGLAAVEGLRGDTSIEDRAYWDNLYIENWSLWLDVKILVRTVVAVLRGTGG